MEGPLASSCLAVFRILPVILLIIARVSLPITLLLALRQRRVKALPAALIGCLAMLALFALMRVVGALRAYPPSGMASITSGLLPVGDLLGSFTASISLFVLSRPRRTGSSIAPTVVSLTLSLSLMLSGYWVSIAPVSPIQEPAGLLELMGALEGECSATIALPRMGIDSKNLARTRFSMMSLRARSRGLFIYRERVHPRGGEATPTLTIEYRGKVTTTPIETPSIDATRVIARRILPETRSVQSAQIAVMSGDDRKAMDIQAFLSARGYNVEVIPDTAAGSLNAMNPQTTILLAVAPAPSGNGVMEATTNFLDRGGKAFFMVSGVTTDGYGAWEATVKDEDAFLTILDMAGIRARPNLAQSAKGETLLMPTLDGSHAIRVLYPYWLRASDPFRSSVERPVVHWASPLDGHLDDPGRFRIASHRAFLIAEDEKAGFTQSLVTDPLRASKEALVVPSIDSDVILGMWCVDKEGVPIVAALADESAFSPASRYSDSASARSMILAIIDTLMYPELHGSAR